MKAAGVLAAALIAQPALAAQPRMSLAQAESYCVGQANSYARRPLPIAGEGGRTVGLLAEYPEDFHVQSFYKRCVKARSGQRTTKRVRWRL